MSNSSKLLRKKLPSLVLEGIFENLANDIQTLHSCTQVNSKWFCEASPILWCNPFSHKVKIHLAIGSYIQEMSLNEKQVIKKSFNISRFEFKSLLPYASFLRFININNFMDAVINFWQKFCKSSQNCMRKIYIEMISKFLIQLLINKSTKIQYFKFVDLYFTIYPNLGNSLVKLVEIQNGLKHLTLTNTFNKHFLNALRSQSHTLSSIEFNSVELKQISLISYIKKCQSLSKLTICNCFFESEGDKFNLVDKIPLKQLVIYNSIAPVIVLLFLCNSSLETFKIIGPYCGDKIEIIFEIIFENDYLEKLAKSLPKYIKEIKIWMVLQPGYEDEVNLDDLCTFFSNINSKSSSVLLEIVIPYNAQVVSKSIQFDEFGKPEKIESKNLKNLTSYNTS
ncbi:12424_t:CDS:2, partial [Racocetra fulgida]